MTEHMLHYEEVRKFHIPAGEDKINKVQYYGLSEISELIGRLKIPCALLGTDLGCGFIFVIYLYSMSFFRVTSSDLLAPISLTISRTWYL